jgi:hypothetical protein
MAATGLALAPAASPGKGGLRIARLALTIGHDGALPPPPVPDAATLAAAIAAATARRHDPGDETLWVVRRLRAAARTDSAEPAAIADALAAALGAQIARLLAGELDDGVCRYRSRAHWLADLIADHARGRARGDWRYRAHADLDALPFALLPRALFSIEAGQAPKVFACLAADHRLAAVITALGPRGAAATLPFLLAPDTGGPPVERQAEALVAMMAQAPPAVAASPDSAALWAIASSQRQDPAPPLPGRATLARALVLRAAPRSRLPAAPAAPAPRAPADVQHGTVAAAAALADTAPSPRAEQPDAAWAPAAIETPFAGIFLLWRSVRALGLDALLADAGPPALLTLAATLAGPERDAAWRDPALHWLTGHCPADAERPLAPPPGLAQALADALARWHAPRPLAPILLPTGSRLRIVADAQSEDWLDIGPPGEIARRWAGRQPAVAAGDAGLRDPARDIAFFGVARRRAARPWALLARAAHADLARRLTGLERSSAAWLWPNVIAGWGRVLPGRRARVWLPSVPLDMVLRVVGIAGSSYGLDDGRSVELLLPGAG